MSNPKGNLATLRKYTPKWNGGKTQTIRVPIALAEKILDYAHQLDNEALTQLNSSKNYESDSSLTQDQEVSLYEALTQMIKVIKQVCQTPHTSKFTRKLKAQLINDVINPLEALTQAKESLK